MMMKNEMRLKTMRHALKYAKTRGGSRGEMIAKQREILKQNNVKVIDIEHHFATEALWREYYALFNTTMEEAETSPERLQEHLDECDLDEMLIGAMDSAGVDFAQISFTTPGSEYFKVETGRELATDSNDRAAEAMRKYPDRIGAYMSLVPDDPEWSLKEIDRCLAMGMWGWCTMSNYGGRNRLDDPKYLPILERCNELKMPIFLHPFFPANQETDEVGYCLSGPSYGFTADTQLTFLRMIYRGIFDKYPDLKIILGHNAEGLGIYIDRIDSAYRQGDGQPNSDFGKIEHEPSYYLRHNLIADTSGSFSPEALNFTRYIFGNQSLVLGTDFPYEDVTASIELILSNKLMTVDEKKAILQDNAMALGFGPRQA